ncbi:hypothetical protein DMUE_1708 [Dictyocoela muelleri]|nr:hypothetical protein DMUE_1708 [Dictyocoela muelleri]
MFKIQTKNDSEKLWQFNFEFAWRCMYCRIYKNIMDDCALKDTKISPLIFLRFAFYFFNKNHFSADYIKSNCKIGECMYKYLLSLFRNKIGEYVQNKKRKLGGVLKQVQIDESFWTRRKYGVGRLGEPGWIWGSVEVKTGYSYLEYVKKRDAETLISIIKDNIEDKSYVVSDQWSTYKKITGYFKDLVCHKYNFVDPNTKANTQCIENLLAHLKKIKHYSYGIILDTITDHLNVFIFFIIIKTLNLENLLTLF